MKYLSLGVLVLASAAVVGAQQYPAPKADDKMAKDPKDLTVTGCVAAGTEPNTFILTAKAASTDAAAPAAPATPPGRPTRAGSRRA
jgi:hypothetical protein